MAPEVSCPVGASHDQQRTARAYSGDEPGEPALGAPRIHGELLKLGFEVSELTVSKYMVHHCGPLSQTWRTFLRNHADAIAAIDLLSIHTVTFDHLFALVIIGQGRR